ncbi:hypothetical protein OSB04_029562 [Centaurea solstitialis]|uniref:Uncharacterized protein n=1 Tax=Centaurea solstitialis TaxID=347529 RepID=A0AA38S735_9ASTR|nr:hypothetical protein OSB04_029561 [Centaurea solstitialis]KAJ9536829.1 hypothetical protein OSB04_029562 [Centaurea solstitialis]
MNTMLRLSLTVLLLLQGLYLIEPSRVQNILPPPLPTQTGSSSPDHAPSTNAGRFKKYEVQAFRPTCPGPSPGVGHAYPPGC